MRIRVDARKCSGCHLCEMVCSLFHFGLINTEKSAIRINKDDLGASFNTPILCCHCKEMKCLEGEQNTENEARETFLWRPERARRCPFNAIPVSGSHAYHCDLCGKDPQCVKVCTPQAITLSRSLPSSFRGPNTRSQEG